jgi:Major Facilitator Superfamily.
MPTERRPGWRDAWAVYAHPRVLGMAFLGFSSGLPFLLVFSTLSAWLTQAGVDRADIGYFSWVGIAYSLKFLWAPVVDRLPLPLLTRWLGRRRGWLLLAQLGVAAGLVAMAGADPATRLSALVWMTVAVAFASATQDICIDAWRIEAVEVERQGAMAASYQFGYRIALLVAGAGALVAAQHAGWHQAYLLMAATMAVGVVTTLLVPEPERTIDRGTLADEARVTAFLERRASWPAGLRHAGAWLLSAVVGPFADFFRRNGWRAALLILAFVALYRLPYLSMGVMANPFYLDHGFTLDQIAAVSKLFGVIMTMIGTAAGGLLVARLGLARTLLVGLLLIGVANLYFALMATMPKSITSLTLAITLDNFGSGIEGTAFIAYLSSLTNTAYTATQYALFSSLWSLPGKFIGGFSGVLVDGLGYAGFFVYTALLTIPALVLMALLWWPRQRPPRAS